MILPNKAITLSNSYLGLGSIVLKELKNRQTPSSLWSRMLNKDGKLTFQKFSITLSFLYSLDIIVFDEGLIQKKN